MARRLDVVPATIGLVAGALVAGLLLPFVVSGTSADPSRATSPSAPLTGTPSGTEGAPTAVGSVTDGSTTMTPGEKLTAPATAARRAPVGDDARPAAEVAGPLRASDRGVTPTSIRLGFLLVEVGQVGRFGFNFPGVDPAQQRRAAQAYVDDINARGGIDGRVVETVFRTFDTLNEDDQRAKCVELTQDEKVFAVIAWAGYFGSPMLCVTVQQQTPLIANGESVPNEFIDQSQGRLVLTRQVGNRLMANLAEELHIGGFLKDKRIGILDSQDGGHTATDNGLLPTLERHGYHVTQLSRLNADRSTSASQVPVEVQQMRSKDVDLVILASEGVAQTQFVQAADAQGWRPQWVNSDWRSNAADSTAQNMPAGYDGAIAVTWERLGEWRDDIPEPPTDVTCREIYERATKERLPRSADGRTLNVPYGVTLRGCNLVRIFEAAARMAGPELTRSSFSAGVQRMGDFPLAYNLGGSFRPTKLDASDVQRRVRFHYGCKCWRVANTPRRSTY